MNKIDLQLIEFLKEYYRIHHDALCIDKYEYDDSGGVERHQLLALQENYKEDEIAPRVLLIVFEFGRIYKERWLLNANGKKGNDRKLTYKEQQNIRRNMSNAYSIGFFSIGVGAPKLMDGQIIWDFFSLQEMFNYCNIPLLHGDIEKLIVYDKKKKLFEFKEK